MASKSESVPAAEVDTPLAKSALDYTNDQYNEVVDSAELIISSLMEQSFKFNNEFLTLKHESPDKQKNSVNCDQLESDYYPDEGICIVYVRWVAEIKFGRKKVLSLRGRYEVVYRGLKDKNEDAVSAFAGRVGRITSYPYFRSLFSILTSEAGIQVPPLPIHRA